MMTRISLGLSLSSLVLLPSLALAQLQDSDNDGVPNSTDAFPCDATRAALTYFPGETTSALLSYEDQWPGATDLDFNDVVVRAHYRAERNAAGNVVRLFAVFDPVALGGDLSNGLGLVLPVPKTGVSAHRRVGGGAWTSLTLEADANVTTVLSPNLRELYGSANGRINSRPNEARQTGQRLEVEFNFATPAALAQGAAPWDVFVFRAGWVSGATRHEIHLPSYSGTGSMAGGLLNNQQDASSFARKFVYLSGVPAALNLMTTTRYPLEGIALSALFPDVGLFASSGGTQNTSFYTTNVVSAQGHDVVAPAVTSFVAPSCIAAGQPCASGSECFSGVCTANVCQAPSLVTSGLIAHLDAANAASYPGSGATWTDLSGNGNHGTISLGEFVSGAFGGYLRNLGNTSDFFVVSMPHSASLNSAFTTTTGGWTIEEIIWTNSVIYPEADAGGVASVPAYNLGSTGFDWNHGITNTSFQFGQSSSSVQVYYDDAPSFAVSAPFGGLNTWRVRTMTWNRGANTNTLYVNGTLISAVATPATAGKVIYDGGGIMFGTLYGWKHFGRRSSIRIYNRVLSGNEVFQNFEAVRTRFGL
jgi:LruC domain-containing protein